jgi:hypothetical protein
MITFKRKEIVPPEYSHAVHQALMCFMSGNPSIAIQLPKHAMGVPDEAFMDEDGWYCEAFDLLTTFGLVSSESKR